MKYLILALALLNGFTNSTKAADETKYRVFVLDAPYVSIARAMAETRKHPLSVYERKQPLHIGVLMALAPADVVSVLQKLPSKAVKDVPVDAAPFDVAAKLGPDQLSVDIELNVRQADKSKRKIDLTVLTNSSFLLSIPAPETKVGETLFLLCPE